MEISSSRGTPIRRVATRTFALSLVMVAMNGLVMPSAAFAAVNDQATSPVETHNDGRSTPGTVVPSTGTTGGEKALTPAPAPPQTRSTARCAALRKRYAESQACFQRFRLQNGGLRPGAARQCKEIKNPSLQCGSEIVG